MKQKVAALSQLLYLHAQPQLILVGGPNWTIKLNELTCCDETTGLSWEDSCAFTKDGLETEMDHSPAIFSSISATRDNGIYVGPLSSSTPRWKEICPSRTLLER